MLYTFRTSGALIWRLWIAPQVKWWAVRKEIGDLIIADPTLQTPLICSRLIASGALKGWWDLYRSAHPTNFRTSRALIWRLWIAPQVKWWAVRKEIGDLIIADPTLQNSDSRHVAIRRSLLQKTRNEGIYGQKSWRYRSRRTDYLAVNFNRADFPAIYLPMAHRM